ncbi:P-II family nitrogen regulator [Thermodesulfobacteriota bacterium]
MCRSACCFPTTCQGREETFAATQIEGGPMKQLCLITCIVEKGKGDLMLREALKAGAQGATYFTGTGTGVRQAIGTIGLKIIPEKEIILIVTRGPETDSVFEAVVAAGRFNEPLAHGFAYITKVEKAVGFLDEIQEKEAEG